MDIMELINQIATEEDAGQRAVLLDDARGIVANLINDTEDLKTTLDASNKRIDEQKHHINELFLRLGQDNPGAEEEAASEPVEVSPDNVADYFE